MSRSGTRIIIMSYSDFINKLKLQVDEEYSDWIIKSTRKSFDIFLHDAYRLQDWVDIENIHSEDVDWLDKKIDEDMLRKGG